VDCLFKSDSRVRKKVVGVLEGTCGCSLECLRGRACGVSWVDEGLIVVH